MTRSAKTIEEVVLGGGVAATIAKMKVVGYPFTGRSMFMKGWASCILTL